MYRVFFPDVWFKDVCCTICEHILLCFGSTRCTDLSSDEVDELIEDLEDYHVSTCSDALIKTVYV